MIGFRRIGKLISFISIAACCSASFTLYAQKSASFNHLSVNDGLSQSTIYSIYQDSKGFMWFGTRGGGLNRYNGYDFQIYRNQPDDPRSLSDNVVLSILEDRNGILWVGTAKGEVNRYDINSGNFIAYPLAVSSEVYENISLAVRCIFEDSSGKIWIGTNQRVYIYNKGTDHFDPVMDDAPFPVKGTTSITEDGDGNFYFATWDRLIRYHPESGSYAQLEIPVDQFSNFGGRIHPLLLDSKNRLWLGAPGGLKIIEIGKEFSFSNDLPDEIDWPDAFNNVRIIKETSDGILWFGTQKGLYAYTPGQTVLKEFKTDPKNPESLNHNSVYSLFEDKVGTLWIGTWSGLSILDKRKYKFELYNHLHNDPLSLSNNVVSSFQEDKKGTWIGTEQGGLNFLNADRTNFTVYKHIEGDPESLPSNNVKSIFLDSNNDLWVGTLNGGLSLHLGKGRFKNFLQGRSVYTFTENPEGKLYIGGRQGLVVMDLETRIISSEVFPPSAGKRGIDTFIEVLFADTKGRIWIGTRNEGLYLFDPIKSLLKQFQSDKADTNSISGNNVISICEDPQQNIWIGTFRGLNRFNEGDFSFDRISKRINLQDNVINGLQADDKGRLWISTNTGLYEYDQQSKELLHYDYLDGLQSNEFNRRACYKNSSGELFFGGVKGFNVFHPDEIKKNLDLPPIVFTDLKLFNESVIPNHKNSPLKKHISETEEIVLSHKQSSFNLEFVALNYLIPEKNSYAYILEGYEDEWNMSGRVRTASYMNLDPGNYTFRVKASNNDKVWNDAGASIAIRVKAPPYASPVAILIYVVVMMGLLYSLIRIVRYRTEKENELKIERAEKDRIKDLNTKRLQFFTNISHEFRTPLTLIAGPLNKLISGNYNHQSDYLLKLMKSNVNRMLRQVNQLMDFRKLENEKMPLRVKRNNLEQFLSQIVLGFEDLANTRMIELKFLSNNSLSDQTEHWFDVGILDKVVYNLLSNAFKFTPEQGIIEVVLTLNAETAMIEVSDTGQGVKQEKVQRIFERFYSDSPDYGSTGIGLSLSKKLIDLHRGTIELDSEREKGAKFIVIIPVSRKAFSDDEVFLDDETFILERPELDSKTSTLNLQHTTIEPGKNNQLMLIVEDNPEMSSYLADHFGDYNLLLAENGEKGYDLAKEHVPDIIISDIMMPGMNGIEFCKAVKKEYLTSHIPVILLTAKAAIDEKIEGIGDTGADAYVEKPFDPEYLSVLVKNIILQRKKLIDKYAGLSSTGYSSENFEAQDQQFIQRINAIVNDHISDPAFGVDHLLVEIGMSRSQLYRKFKAISDKNPSEYIRILRLQYACSILNESNYNVSEVAYMSGFGNVSYFNTCFKKHFGVSPGKYLTEKLH